jgi:hypothetical protein
MQHGADAASDGGAVFVDAANPPDAQSQAPDATVADASAAPDASEVTDASAIDAGQPPQPDASAPDSGTPISLGDLTLAFTNPGSAVSFRTQEVNEDDCELFEGCLGGTGRRSLMELSFTLRNEGGGAIDLGRPFESELFHASLCQHAYVIDDFFAVELRDENGALVAAGSLTSACVAGESGAFDCTAQGLGAGESSEQPAGLCDFLDVTGLPEGNYALKVSVNPDRVVAEASFDNNSAEIVVYHSNCPGTICGGTCCPEGVECFGDVCMLPDLRVNRDAAAESLWLTHQTFEDNSCELEEMCVNGSGRRRLLQFEGRIENWGPGDLNPGDERDNPLFEYSSCHDHHHFTDFTDYQLLNADGSVAASGHKQSFCLVDMVPVEGAIVPAPPGTRPGPGPSGCSYLSAGWADIYGVGTPCQWIDVTDVPEGDYVLALSVNPLGRVAETVTDNNTVQIAVHLPADVPCDAVPEVCGDSIDQDCDDLPDIYDPDCNSGCFPWDPFCEVVVSVEGNETCASAREMDEQATYQTWIEADNASDIAPPCGGAGGDAFFRFTLESEQAVYLGAFGSDIDTVLAVHADDCEGASLRCEDDACGDDDGHFADVLSAGSYLVAVKAKNAGQFGRVRLKFQHADAGGARVIDAPGIYAGDTSTSDDSVTACLEQDMPQTGGDGGVVEPPIGGMGGPPLPGPRGPIGIGGSSGGGVAGAGSVDAGVSADGGIGGPFYGEGPDDVYVVAACYAGLIASTCGTSEFSSIIEVRAGSLAGPLQSCTSWGDVCASDPLGAAAQTWVPNGLSFITVDGATENDYGAYQLSVSY